MPIIKIRPCEPSELNEVDALVAAYHRFEAIDLPPATRRQGVMELLENDHLGRIWLIEFDAEVVGYIAVCFGYSIEFAGRDAFIDEFFINEDHRGRGLGSSALELVATEMSRLNIAALHLEVARSNSRSARLYAAAGFEARSKYQLMTRKLRE
ncbi:MAG: ribosomal protein S18 acetylase RimI-like enzyme [Gammaproteobacteria bacterium]|jgi:ribosomal protein S18 acetylase RimI-like enzyme